MATNPYAPISIPDISAAFLSPEIVTTEQTFKITVTVTETIITPQDVYVQSGQIQSGQAPFG